MTLFASAASLCAFSAAQAETLTYTGFETAAVNPAYVAGQALSTTNDDMNRTSDDMEFEKTWCPIELDDGEAVVTAYDDNTMRAATNVSTFTSTDLLSNYLKLDTGTNQVARCAQTGGEPVEMDGIYIDTLVKFTVTEDAEPGTTDGDKLCIWVGIDSDTGATNLMVTAGYISDDSGENITPTKYVTDYSFGGDDIDNWHRLTVKAIAGIDEFGVLNGFVIYVDGVVVGTSTPVMCDDFAVISPLAVAKAFPSLIYSGRAGGGTLESIGFQGFGSIDNVQFTETNPIPPAPGPTPSTYELTITATGDATNTVWTATTNGISVASGDFIEDGQAVVVVVTPNTGWEYATTPADWSEGTAGAITRTFTVSGAALEITIPAPTAKSSGFDGGETGKTFSIDAATQATLALVLPSGKTLTDVADMASGMTYAQAYALGLLDETTGDVTPLTATIEVLAGGKVKVSLNGATKNAKYQVTLKVYEKTSLTEVWPTDATLSYDLGSSDEATGFAPYSATSGFYKVKVVIVDGTSN